MHKARANFAVVRERARMARRRYRASPARHCMLDSALAVVAPDQCAGQAVVDKQDERLGQLDKALEQFLAGFVGAHDCLCLTMDILGCDSEAAACIMDAYAWRYSIMPSRVAHFLLMCTTGGSMWARCRG